MSSKDEVLEKLSLLKEEPEEENLYFNFGTHAEEIKELLVDVKTHTPYVIALHGEWGSGKTSLILKIQELVQKEITNKQLEQWHQIRFDVWEYERVDILSSLFQIIEKEYESYKTKEQKYKEKLLDFGKSTALFFTDVALRNTAGIDLDSTKAHFQNFVTEIPNIKKKLEDLVDNGRLIIFVDDLDRCHVDNVLDMLEAIKMFLTAKNVIFVMAVDMHKIERAWRLRYKTEEGSIEGREHIEKIFPLKLTLPPKDPIEITKYVEKMCESLSENERNILVQGCPHNPRKIKRIVNLVYFVLKNLDDDGEFDKKVPLVIVWCIITSTYPELSKIFKQTPAALTQLSLLVINQENNQSLIRSRQEYENAINAKKNITISGMTISHNWILPSTVEALIHILDNDIEALNVFKAIGNYYHMVKPDTEKTFNQFDERIKTYHENITEPIKDVIYHSSLIG